MVKYQAECREGKEDAVATYGSHVSIPVGAVRIMGKEEGMVVHLEEGRMECVGERGRKRVRRT